MKAIKRDVAGHFILADKCGFFLHTDIVPDKENDAFRNASFCISLIGEYHGEGSMNISGRTYELMVFDKGSENPWSEVEGFYIDDKQEAINKHDELVKKYLEATTTPR